MILFTLGRARTNIFFEQIPNGLLLMEFIDYSIYKKIIFYLLDVVLRLTLSWHVNRLDLDQIDLNPYQYPFILSDLNSDRIGI